MKKGKAALIGWIVGATLWGASAAMASEDVVIVYDASASMWGQIEGTAKMRIARDVMADLVEDWNSDTQLGLVAYGHRTEGDCSDIETLIAPGRLDKVAFIDHVNNIRPVGKTPLTAAVQHAAELLSYRDTPATVVLISDGVETCNADPCALSTELARQGVRFKAHVVGFDLDSEGQAELACIAQNTGGIFVPASNAGELTEALKQVQAAMTIPDEPALEAEPTSLNVTVSAPQEVTTGAVFEISWAGTINGQDFLTIVPMGAEERTIDNHLRAKDNIEGRLTAPGTPGLYELRYVLEEGRRVLASQTVEVVEAEVTVSAPQEVTTGAVFEISWAGTINGQDFLTIVPMGAEERTIDNHLRAKDNTEGRVTAPGTPGLYELRYVLEEGRRVLASQTVEVIEAEIGITGPDKVRAGETVDVTWSSTINSNDFITIVPAGAGAGTINKHIRTRSNTEGRLSAPDEAGLYEIRYVLEEGRATLSSITLEVVHADAPLDKGTGLSVPGVAAPGDTITVKWATPGTGADQRIALARRNQSDFSWISAQRIGKAREIELAVPDESGLYEVRFLDLSEQAILGRSVVEVK